LEEKLGVPVHVANDARCQLWAHAWFGRLLKAHANLLYLLFTEGVGSSSIIHNRIVNGANFAAGEIGHVRAGNEHRLCRCGNYDCLETYAGLEALLAEIRKRHPDIAQMRTVQHIVQAARKFPDVDRIVDGAVQRCAVAVAWMWAMLEPEAVVIGSRDREFSELLRGKFIAHLRILGCEKVQDSRILAAESEDHTMLQGIAGFIFESGYKSDQLSVVKNGNGNGTAAHA
jgi:predicted NBD/HSP70 family sugar kinase